MRLKQLMVLVHASHYTDPRLHRAQAIIVYATICLKSGLVQGIEYLDEITDTG